MQTRSFIPQDWTRPLSGYRLAGWLEGFGLLAGVGAIPLLARLSWLDNWFWVVSLAAGLLVVGAGLYYVARFRRITRVQARREDPDQVLVDEQLSGRTIKVTARRKSQAASGADAASPEDAAPPAGADPQDDLRQAAILIILGTFILVPAVSVPLLCLAEVEEAHRAAAFLGGPALMLWATFESLAFYAHWVQRSSGRVAILGLFRSGAQVLAALLVWIFLGLADGIPWTWWLFGIAAGLALLSALAATFMPLAGASLATTHPSVADLYESSPTGAHAEPLFPPAQTAEVAEPLPQLEAPTIEQVPVAAKRGVFQIFRGRDGQFYFHLRAANGEIILSSEGYQSKSGCQKGIQSVQQNAPLSERYKHYEASDGKYYFILKAANHQVIGASQRYITPAGREAGIRAVMRVAPQAGVEEVE